MQDKGVKESSIQGTSWRWKMDWRIHCADLDMTVTGVDRVDLDADLQGFFPQTFLPPPERQ